MNVSRRRILFSSLNGECGTAARSLLESGIIASNEIHGGRLQEVLGREKIGPIHHLALRGLLYKDGRHTLEETFASILEAAGYTRWRSGEMASIKGSYIEWAPAGSLDSGFRGLPENPYVFSSLCHVDRLDAQSQNLLQRLRPLLLGEVHMKHHEVSKPPLLPLTIAEYSALKVDSQYAAWFVTNTLLVRALDGGGRRQALNHLAYVLNDNKSNNLSTCAQMNQFLTENGWSLNTYNGQSIQADDDDDYHFRQSSVVATPVQVLFQGDQQPTSVPGIFHEFVEHPYNLPFRGFSNARALFSSTSTLQK